MAVLELGVDLVGEVASTGCIVVSGIALMGAGVKGPSTREN